MDSDDELDRLVNDVLKGSAAPTQQVPPPQHGDAGVDSDDELFAQVLASKSAPSQGTDDADRRARDAAAAAERQAKEDADRRARDAAAAAERQAKEDADRRARDAAAAAERQAKEDADRRARDAAAADDDIDDEALLQQALAGVRPHEKLEPEHEVPVAEPEPRTFGRSSVPSEPAAIQSSAPQKPSDRSAALVETFRNAHVTERRSTDFSMREEEQILQAILSAIADSGDGGAGGDALAGELEYNDVDAILDHAERLATSTAHGNGGASVLQVVEQHVLRDELRRAKSTAGSHICIGFAPSSVSPNAVAQSAVGTTLGVVLLMNAKQKIVGVCGSASAQGNEAKGAVVSLSFNATGDMLIAGYERGSIALWDSAVSLQLLRFLSDEFEAPVVRISASKVDPMKFVALDSEGTLRLYLLSKVVSRIVFRTTSLQYEDLDSHFLDAMLVSLPGGGMPPSGATSSLPTLGGGAATDPLHLVCAVSAEEAVVFNGVSGACLFHYHAAPSSLSSISNSLVQWVANGDKWLLVISWATTVEVLQVISLPDDHENEMNCVSVSVTKAPRPISTSSLLDGPCVLFVDQEERAHAFDAVASCFVESIRLLGLDPVSFSGKRSGMIHHGSIARCDTGSVTLLGNTKALACSVLPWNVRLDALMMSKKFDEAFQLAKGFATDSATAAVGLSFDSATRKRDVQSHLVQLIAAKISATVKGKASQKEFGTLVDFLLEYCASVDSLSVFFGPTLDFLTQLQLRDLALYRLELALRRGVVSFVPTAVIDAFSDLFLSPARLAAVNDPEHPFAALPSHDRLEYALMCVEGAYDTLLSIADTRGFLRLTCFIESYRRHLFVNALDMLLKRGTPEGDAVAVEFFLQTLKGCTLLPGFPIQLTFQKVAKQQLLQHLIQKRVDVLDKLLRCATDDVLSGITAAITDTHAFTSPWNESLTKAQCLHALWQCFVDESSPVTRPWEVDRNGWAPFPVYIRFLQLIAGEIGKGTITHGNPLFASATVDRIALAIIYHHTSCASSSYSAAPKPSLASSVAGSSPPPDTPKPSLIEYRDALQQTLIDLLALNSAVLTGIGCSWGTVETELQNKKLGRTLAYVKAFKRRDFLGALECFLDKEFQREVPTLAGNTFPFIYQCLETLQQRGESAALDELRKAVKDRIQRLVEIDATALAQFVFEHLPGEHADVISALRGSESTFLRYLKELVGKGGTSVEQDQRIQDNYIELLSKFEPEKVYPYLHERDTSIAYDLHAALETVQRYQIVDATIFLLERTVMIDEAMVILMDTITRHLQALRSALIEEIVSSQDVIMNSSLENASQDSAVAFNLTMSHMHLTTTRSLNPVDLVAIPAKESAEVLRMVNVGIDLCTRYHNRSSQAAKNWFRMLDRFSKPKRLLFDRQVVDRSLRITVDTQPLDGFDDNEIDIADRQERAGKAAVVPLLQRPLSLAGCVFIEKMQQVYTQFMSHILTHMTMVLDLSIVVGKIVEDNERERFGPFKPIIVNILESLSFDLTVNRLCKLCTDADTMSLGLDLVKLRSNGIKPRSEVCGVCGAHLSVPVEGLDVIRFFSCGHGYHEHCGAEMQECQLCASLTASSRAATSLLESAAAAAAASSAPHQHRRGTMTDKSRGGKATQSNDKDIGTIVRRLRHTRSKLDGGKNYYDLLQTLLKQPSGGDTASSPSVTTQGKPSAPATGSGQPSASKQLLLAPNPPPPVAVGEMQVGRLTFLDAMKDVISQEDMCQIFGDEIVGKSVYGARHDSTSAPLSGGGETQDDDEDDFDLDEALRISEGD